MNNVLERIIIAIAVPALLAGAVKLFTYIIRKRLKSKSAFGNDSEGAVTGRQTLLYFWTPDCSQCKWQEKYLEQATTEMNSSGRTVNVKKINAYQEQEYASSLNVITVPTLVILDSAGKVASWNPGLTRKNKIIDLLTIAAN